MRPALLRLDLFLAWRHLARHPMRQVLSLAGITLAVAMATAVTLSDRSIVASYRTLLDSLAGRAQLQVVPLSEGGIPPALLERARAEPAVAAAVPGLRASALLFAGEETAPVLAYGIDAVLEPRVRTVRLLAGRLPARGERRTVVLGAAAAQTLGGLGVGDRVALEGASTLASLTVVGLLDDASDLGRATLGHCALLDLAAARELFARRGFDRIDLLLAPEASATVAGRPESVETVAGRLAIALGPLVRVDTPRGQGEDRERHLRSLEILMALAGFLAAIAGLSILAGNRAVAIRERRGEIAALRLLGARRRDVLRLLLGETLGLGLGGTCLGLAVGIAASRAIAGWAARDFLASFDLVAGDLVLAPLPLLALAAGGVLATVLTTLPPARAALRESPLAAAHAGGGEDGPGGGEGPPRTLPAALPALLVGAGLLAAVRWAGGLPAAVPVLAAGGFLALLYGICGALPARLARPVPARQARAFSPALRFGLDAVSRAPRRAALVVLGLALPLALLVGIGGIAASQRHTLDRWFERRIGWDFAISRSSYRVLGSQENLPAGLLAAVAAVPGIAGVSPQKYGVVGVAGEQATLWVLDSRHIPWYSDLTLIAGDSDAALTRLVRGGAALVSLPLARRHDLGVGSSLELATPAGPRRFAVVGIIEELGSANGTVQLDWRDYVRSFDGGFSQLVVRLAPGAEPAVVRAALGAVLARSPGVRLQSSAEFYRDVFAGLDSFYRLLDGLLAISLGTACLALINGLWLSVLERRRTLALARVNGMLHRQILAAVAWESLLYGVWAGAAGIALGLGFGLASVATAGLTTGVTLSFRFPLAAVATAALFALVAAPLCALVPGRRAAAHLPLTLLSER